MQSLKLAARRWWYIMPIVFITYSLAYLDRANYGFAAASGMAADLNITPGLSSLLGALFFLGYFFFQVPGAIYAQKNSVKKLIFVSLILWGSLATLTGVVSNAYTLIVIRFMLGVVEAAVMPAMLVYLCHWFTSAERSRANTFLILGLSGAAFQLGEGGLGEFKQTRRRSSSRTGTASSSNHLLSGPS